MAPTQGDDGQVRAVRSEARRLVPTGPDLHQRFWSSGKPTPETDVIEARYTEIVPDVRVVQAVDFVSDDPAFAGTMTMTWGVSAVQGGARVDIVAVDVPDGISGEEHATGLSSSLANLAALFER